MSDGLDASTWNPDMYLISTNIIYIILHIVVSTDNYLLTLQLNKMNSNWLYFM